jgi:hypothetical protein
LKIFIFEMKNWKTFISEISNEKNWKIPFEIWNENFRLKFQKIGHTTGGKWKKIWNEEIIYFVYATEIKLWIIPLYCVYFPMAPWNLADNTSNTLVVDWILVVHDLLFFSSQYSRVCGHLWTYYKIRADENFELGTRGSLETHIRIYGSIMLITSSYR